MKRRIGFVCLIALMASFFLATAAFAVAQREAVLSETEITIDLAVSPTHKLYASVLPAKANQSVIWKSGNKNIAIVSTKGLIKALRKGDLKISVRPSKVSTKTMCTVHVIDSMCPDSVVLHYEGSKTLNVFDKVSLSAFALPSDKSQSIRFRSSNPRVLSVTPTDGILTARAKGTARITAYYPLDPSVSAYIDFTVKLPTLPKKFTILPQGNTLFMGDTLQLSAVPTPSEASNAVTWSSSNSRIASVTQTGIVTGKREGIVKIKAVSKFNKKVYTVRTLKIVDKTVPTSFSVAVSGTLTTGVTSQLAIDILPETARDAEITWKISDPNVAEVSPTGLLKLQNAGRARIIATTVKGKLRQTIDIVVTDPTSPVCVVTPARTTDISGISANIQRIEAVENSAYQVLEKLLSAGAIPPSEATDRREVIERAFEMQKFVWMTKKRQPYWKAANSENGLKNFKPGVVYYGFPYIQRAKTNINRRYGVSRALSEKRYYASGDGYYILNQNNLLGGSYCGSDCSSFLSQAQLVHPSRKYDLCSQIASSSLYKTVLNGYTALRPGDLIIRANRSAHVVMFLYYTNSSKTRMMIIEQGGGSPGDPHNTISCSIMNITKYSGDGYKVMRKTRYK